MAFPTIVQEYPQFVENQVLTQDQLNNMRDFLDSQNRLTRVKLVGIGIICGLHARINEVGVTDGVENIEITLSEGYGVTSEGWLICLKETTFSHFQIYDDPGVISDNEDEFPVYLPWRKDYNKENHSVPGADPDHAQIDLWRLRTEPDPLSSSHKITNGTLEDKILLLYLERDEKQLKSCFTTDCNNKGMSISMNVVALLAEKGPRFLIETGCGPLSNLIHSPRFVAGLMNAESKSLSEISDFNEINRAYTDICSYLYTELVTKTKPLLEYYKIFFDLFDFEESINEFEDRLNDLLGSADRDQYDFDLAKDLVRAHNELKASLCEIVQPCMPAECFPRHLVLYDLTSEVLSDNLQYRHPFFPSPLKNVVRNDFERARHHFIRILQLVDHFSLRKGESEYDIKVTPSKSENYKLGERAIPYYYSKPDIERWWQTDPCCHPPVLSYADNLMGVMSRRSEYPAYVNFPLFYNINGCDMFRIEGHLDFDYKTVLTELDNIIRFYNLEFRVIALPIQVSAVDASLLPEMSRKYEELQSIWVNLYKKIEEEITKEDYDEYIGNLNERSEEITGLQAIWCNGRSGIRYGCNLSPIQSDYNILRSELLCWLAKCSQLLSRFPDIDLGSAGGPSGEVCLDFESLGRNRRLGKGDTEQGEVSFEENNVVVTAEDFMLGDDGTYGDAQVRRIPPSDEHVISFNNLNLKFHFESDRLGFVPNEVIFRYSDSGGFENLGFNTMAPTPLEFREFVNIGPKELTGGLILEITQLSETLFQAKLSGVEFTSVTLGGQEFQLYDICIYGSGNGVVEFKKHPEFSFESRFDRLRSTGDILAAAVPEDIKCFNFDLFQYAIKDHIGAAIDIKLFLSSLFRSSEGAFLPYKYYPVWNDFEDCLDDIHQSCLYSRFKVMYWKFEYGFSKWIRTFGNWAQKHPGAEHRAGVSKGGTFILVYQDEESPNVVADFSMEQSIDDCCECTLDIDTLHLPPVALHDYHIIEISQPGVMVEMPIPVIGNDFNLEEDSEIKLLAEGPDTSDKGASLMMNAPYNGYITYKISEASEGIDHFTYFLINEKEHIDIGHIHILFLYGSEEPEQSGSTGGIVIESGSDRTLPDVRIDLFNESTSISTRSHGNGRFLVREDSGVYSMSFEKPGFLGRRLDEVHIRSGEVNDLGIIPLIPIAAVDERNDRNLEIIRGLEANYGDTSWWSSSILLMEEIWVNERSDTNEINKKFDAIVDQMLTTTISADNVRKKAINSVLNAVTHTYMDWAVTNNTEKVDPGIVDTLAKTVHKLRGAKISTNSLLNKWKSNELRTRIVGSNDAIVTLRNVFKE